jgi:hypothetical protein
MPMAGSDSFAQFGPIGSYRGKRSLPQKQYLAGCRDLLKFRVSIPEFSVKLKTRNREFETAETWVNLCRQSEGK